MRHIITLLVFIATCSVSFLSRQDIELKGKIIDAHSGDPVASATISVKGTTYGTTSAHDGTFALSVPAGEKTIVVSALGYSSKEIKMTPGTSFLNIKLKASANKSEEVVVSGYSRAYEPAADELQERTSGIAYERKSRVVNSSTINHEKEYNTEDYDAISENRFLEVINTPLSTFSVDVDGASYSNVRRFLQQETLPPPGSVRIEELINYFKYNYPQPSGEHPLSITTEVGGCPWNNKHKLVMIGLQGKTINMEDLPASNLVFLVDVSGSMMTDNKLPLVKSSLRLLVDQLREEDKVSLVVYAGSAGLVLSPTSGDRKQKIKDAIDALEAGGSTAGGEGIKLAYNIARKNFVEDGNNRVILCTDGDFNVGVSSDAALEKIIEEERKSGVFLTVLGYGMGNYKDNKMQRLADKGNGNHSYIDNINEAKKVLVNEFGGTLFTIAKDVKLQVEFNPSFVQAYRLVGYENRMLNKEDFNNDLKDAGDIGSGHTVTALYEIIPTGVKSKWIEKTDALKYQANKNAVARNESEIMNIKFRYKKPDGDKSALLEHAVRDVEQNILSENFRFVTAVAQYGLLLNNSEFRQNASFESARQLARRALNYDAEGYRKEFLKLIDKAEGLMEDQANSSR